METNPLASTTKEKASTLLIDFPQYIDQPFSKTNQNTIIKMISNQYFVLGNSPIDKYKTEILVYPKII